MIAPISSTPESFWFYRRNSYEDYWEIFETQAVRHHIVPRTKLFTVDDANVPLGIPITTARLTKVVFKARGLGTAEIHDDTSD